MATVRSELHEPVQDFNESFVDAWKITHNYRVWAGGDAPDMSNCVPG